LKNAEDGRQLQITDHDMSKKERTPSVLMRRSSISFCWVGLRPDETSAGPRISLTFLTAVRTPGASRIRQPMSLRGGLSEWGGPTLAHVGVLVAVTELDGLVDTGRSARGDGRGELALGLRGEGGGKKAGSVAYRLALGLGQSKGGQAADARARRGRGRKSPRGPQAASRPASSRLALPYV
jgi:hypothetical protein